MERRGHERFRKPGSVLDRFDRSGLVPSTMGRIARLDETVANQIAAGEVIERPASVVKELIENSVDAEATRISVDVEEGGVGRIRVVDDGCGMTRDDALLCLERHATSKIRSARDIETVLTMGFRGEAIPSIASVSRFELVTRTRSDSEGTRIIIEGGRILSVDTVGAPMGTSIDVRDLFFNLPARRKFLKRAQTEAAHVDEAIERVALAFSNIAFRVVHDDRVTLDASVENDRDPRGRLGRILGAAVARRLYVIEPVTTAGIQVSGFVGSPDLVDRTNKHIRTFVNKRFIRDRTLTHAIQESFRSLIAPQRQPAAILHIEMPSQQVDVNAHPQKLEVRFANPNELHRAVTTAVARTLARRPWVEQVSTERTYVLEPRGAILTQTEAPRASANDLGARGPEISDRPPAITPRTTAQPPSMRSFEAASTALPNEGATLRRDPVDRSSVLVDRPAGPTDHKRRIAEALAALGRRRLSEERAPELVPEPTTSKYFGSLEPLGQALGRFLICQGARKVVLIDQEAAHRKLLIARLSSQFRAGTLAVQPILIPIAIELDRRRSSIAEQELERLRSFGFALEPFGGSTWLLKSAPAAFDSTPKAELVLELLDDLAELGGSASLDRAMERIFARTASHASVRAGDRLSKDEIRSLLDELDAFQVPREDLGRPLAVEWNDKELDRLFARRSVFS